ncbi:MAG: amidohydrolase family protein [Myxococcales bacterium]|nr:amidohydrolase family protein [Myxococcales bacterium]
MLDILIHGGTVVDGTGAPGRSADIGLRDGRIAVVGKTEEQAKETIDVKGRIVAPGFVDIHTHYDAQVFWDGTLSPSSYHGVTSVAAGNCGFSIAPLGPGAGEYLMHMLARVEGMPLESLREGVPWSWTSFGEYLDLIDGTLAVNAGFMVGHSALRRVVMGERAVGHEATPDELKGMERLLAESLEGGGLGFSSTIASTHNDGDGNPVPSRHASREELVALARVVRDFPGTTLEFLPGVTLFTEKEKSLMTDLSLAANRPLNWNLLAPSSQSPGTPEKQLSATDYARERGAEVLALTVPQSPTVRINLATGFVFDALPGWADLFRLSIDDRKKALEDPEYREKLDRGAHSEEAGMLRGLANWGNMLVDQIADPDNESLRGRRIAEIAEEQGKTTFDAMLDLAVSEDLKTSFCPGGGGGGDDDATWKLRGEAWHDDRTIIGASDAGAHLDMIDTFAFSTQVLGNGVRERGVISLEEAVRQLADVPARLYGMRERGQLQEGWHGDVVVFDKDTVATGPTYTRNDLPTGAGRLYADAVGIDHVFCNGVEIVRHNETTGALPGTVFRSGRDLDTVEVPGGSK